MDDSFEVLQDAYYQHLKTIDESQERLRLTNENLDSANQTNQALCKKLNLLRTKLNSIEKLAQIEGEK
jgi:hypothetical protein